MKTTTAAPKIKTYSTIQSLWCAVCREAGVYEARANKTRKKWMSRWTMAHKVAGTPEYIALHNALARAREIMVGRAVGAFIARNIRGNFSGVKGEAGIPVFFLQTNDATAVLGPVQDEMNRRARGAKGQYLAVFKNPEQDEKGSWVLFPKNSKK